MKTKKQVLRESPKLKALIKDIVDLVGMDSITIAGRWGWLHGTAGINFVNNTWELAEKHQRVISIMLKNAAGSSEKNIAAYISNTFYGGAINNKSRKELSDYVFRGKCGKTVVTRLIAWFALWEVCALFEE